MLEDRSGREVAKIQERKPHVRDTMAIERDGRTVAKISRKWFRVRETYGVEIRAGEDEPLLLAVTVALDEMANR